MNKDDKLLLQQFENLARPTDKVNYIMQKEMLFILKEIRKELKILNTE